MLLCEIAADYYKAAELIQKQITKLCKREKSPTVTHRISSLKNTKWDMLHMAKLCEHYYERGFWHGEYGAIIDTNRRATKRVSKVGAEHCRDKRRNKRTNEKAISVSNSSGIDAKTATDIANAIF